MKIREGFILRDVAGKSFVVATGKLSQEFQGMITLNETGKFIWQQLEAEKTSEEIVNAIMNDFEDADMETVRTDVEKFIDRLVREKIVE